MPLVESRTVEMGATLSLTEREVEMLAWLAGYGGEQIAKAICKSLTSRFTEAEWDKFWTEARSALERQHVRFRETRNVFIGNQ